MVIAQYRRTVRPMHHEFVEPSKRNADIIIPEGGQIGVGIEFLCSMVREKLNEEQLAVK
jgi:uridine kinase